MQVIELVADTLKYFGPLIALAAGVLTAWSLYKWARRLGVASKEMFKSPISAFFTLLMVGLFLWFYFTKLAPYLEFIA